MMTNGKRSVSSEKRDALNVLWNHRLVGTLMPAQEGYVIFQYADTWLSAEARPVSLSLPCQAEPFEPFVSTAYFGGMLPEGDVREEVAAHYGMYDSDTYALLKRLGRDCAGALQIVPPLLLEETSDQSYRDITPILEDLLSHRDELLTEPNLFLETGARLSLAGSQSKLPVVFKEGRFFLPPANTPTTHIIKPQGIRFRFLVENEDFCTQLACKIGLDAARTEIVEISGQRVLCSSRFDRRLRQGQVTRVHQEDFCQALGIPSERKYQEDGGPGFMDCRTIIERHAFRNKRQDIDVLADAALFNFIIGNTDAHGKNFAFFHFYDGTYAMTPLYDLVCTSVYGLDGRFAMTIRTWEQLAEELGMEFSQLAERKKNLSEQVESMFSILLMEHRKSYPAGTLHDRLEKLIPANLERLNTYFPHPTKSPVRENTAEDEDDAPAP